MLRNTTLNRLNMRLGMGLRGEQEQDGEFYFFDWEEEGGGWVEEAGKQVKVEILSKCFCYFC